MSVRFIAVVCFLCGCGEILAAPPTVENVAPGIGQRGTEFSLILSGSRLTGPQELLLYSPGVKCTKLAATGENEVTATIQAAADCNLGEYPFRLRTKGGASEVHLFRITPFPVVMEKEPNDTREQAQSVAPNVSIAGVIETAGFDYYSITLKKGQRLSAEVEGVRLGILNDTAMAVFDPEGKEIAFSDDTALYHQDPFVSLIAPVDGAYTVQVRHTTFGGGETARYVLHLGTFARPYAVYPAGAQAGAETPIQLFDSTGIIKQTLKLPPADTPFEYFPSYGDVAAPTPMPFRVSPFANVNEVEPNDDPKQANAAVGWPVAFNGIIDKSGDVDHFRFTAKKGDLIEVQAFGFRIGSPIDTVVSVLDAQFDVIGSSDDDETHDSRLMITIPRDGEYYVRVIDKRGQGGSSFIYRIELDMPKQGLAVFLPDRVRKSQDRQVIMVPRGNRVAAYLAVRRDGFAGPVTLNAGELPTGVRTTLATISPDEYLLPVVFEAAPDAPLGAKLVEITGTNTSNGKPITGGFAQIVTTVSGPGDSALHSVALSKLAIMVVEETPLSVSIVPPTTSLPVDGTLDVKVRITRGKDFTEPVEVTFPALPPGVEVPTAIVIPPEQAEAVVTLVASKDADIGNWKLIAEAKPASAARAKRDPAAAGMMMGGAGRRGRRGSSGSVPTASELVAMQVTEAPVKGELPLTGAEQGKTVKVICKFESAKPLPAGFTAKLDGLPPRTTAEAVTLKADPKQVEFTVAVAATTPPGAHNSLVCELTGTIDGQKVVYRIGRGGILKVDLPGAVKTDANGKVLSPLEALRLEQKK
jgi:hypothetical protein